MKKSQNKNLLYTEMYKGLTENSLQNIPDLGYRKILYAELHPSQSSQVSGKLLSVNTYVKPGANINAVK